MAPYPFRADTMHTPPTMREIVKRNADKARAAGITAKVDSPQSWVTITCRGEEDIFLQTHEADAFIDEARELFETLQTVTMDDCHLHLAINFSENIWN
jgi:hypothetical protein